MRPPEPGSGPAHDPEEYWDARYREGGAVWSGRPNVPVVDAVRSLSPGRALDLGCGEGGDAIWLAERGWSVTGVDISPSAIARAREAAGALGVAPSPTFVVADLSTWEPEGGPFDLVMASFLHSPVDLARTAVLRRGADEVAPGGHLLIVSHVTPPTGMSTGGHTPPRFLTPAQELDALGLDGGGWEVCLMETRTRRRTPQVDARAGGPEQRMDGILLLRRLSS